MDIACVMNVHKDVECILDTVDSVLVHMTDKLLVLVNGTEWEKFKSVNLPVGRIEGFRHAQPRAPYRNMALGLKMLAETWPETDWYCYCEYDVLFASDRFKYNLRMAAEMGVWMLGNDGHVDDVPLPLIESMIGQKFRSGYYLLGCCQFFHKDFIQKLVAIDFFDRFLSLTNGFAEGYFPLYSGYDLSEHMYPTLCRHFGGKVGVWATYDRDGTWHDDYQHYPCRWKPELDPDTEDFPEASIMHPLKSANHPIRKKHREKRLQWKLRQEKQSL